MNIAPPISTRGARLIAAERQRQITQEGWTPEHDDEHEPDALTSAAVCYALAATDRVNCKALIPDIWPWDEASWKPSDDAIRDLVKAGALIAAEIDRLQRLKGDQHG